MKKLGSTIVVLSFTQSIFSQVGINTTSPAATFDITAKNATGTSTNADGLLIPRVDRQRAQNMTSVIPSTLIYVDSIATGTAEDAALNITSIGYYYFDGTLWIKLNPGSSASSSSVNTTSGASFNVNDLIVTKIPGTSQSITIPTGGKALFINFMLGIDYGSIPTGSGTAYYEARLYIDEVATDCYMRTQEYGPGGLSAQFFST